MDLINIYYKDIENITKFYYTFKKDIFNNFGYELEDVIQEVCIFICKYSKEYDKEKANIKTYLDRIIKSCIKVLIRNLYNEKRKANLKEYSEVNENELYNDYSIEFLELKETITKELTDKEKNILLLLMEGYTLEDIGKIYNITRQGVYCYKNKIKNKLSMYI